MRCRFPTLILHGFVGLALLFWISPAYACRYSVRDAGFVDLGTHSFRLRSRFPRELSEIQRAALLQKARVLLSDSNISVVELSDSTDSQHPPGFLLEADTEQGLSIPVGKGSSAEFEAALHSIASSPTRDRLYQETLRAYAVVLLIEGTDTLANRRARADAQTAIEATTRLLASMPKPVSIPPQQISLSPDQQTREAVLLWGLGLDPALTDGPRIVLVYGRGRRLGAPLEGPLITQTALRDRLILIGQDCECDLDRAWLRGPLLPGRWTLDLQKTALTQLGFDPSNPMVRAEISRIVERGPQVGPRKRPPSSTQALGYSEDAVETSADSPSVDDPPEATDLLTPKQIDSTQTDSRSVQDLGTKSSQWAWGLLGLTLLVALSVGSWFALKARRR